MIYVGISYGVTFASLRKLLNETDDEGFELELEFIQKTISEHTNIVTYKSTVARTVICPQDGRGRFPVCWTISPNVGQTHKENPNLVRILYMKFT